MKTLVLSVASVIVICFMCHLTYAEDRIFNADDYWLKALTTSQSIYSVTNITCHTSQDNLISINTKTVYFGTNTVKDFLVKETIVTNTVIPLQHLEIHYYPTFPTTQEEKWIDERPITGVDKTRDNPDVKIKEVHKISEFSCRVNDIEIRRILSDVVLSTTKFVRTVKEVWEEKK